MGAVHKETPAQNKGFHEYESVSLSDPKCIASLIKFRSVIYPTQKSCTHFSELMTCIYLDIDELIRKTPMRRVERETLKALMKGDTIQDVAFDQGTDERTVVIQLETATRRMAMENEKAREKSLRTRLYVKCL